MLTRGYVELIPEPGKPSRTQNAQSTQNAQNKAIEPKYKRNADKVWNSIS